MRALVLTLLVPFQVHANALLCFTSDAGLRMDWQIFSEGETYAVKSRAAISAGEGRVEHGFAKGRLKPDLWLELGNGQILSGTFDGGFWRGRVILLGGNSRSISCGDAMGDHSLPDRLLDFQFEARGGHEFLTVYDLAMSSIVPAKLVLRAPCSARRENSLTLYACANAKFRAELSADADAEHARLKFFDLALTAAAPLELECARGEVRRSQGWVKNPVGDFHCAE